jgi:hypothetical protein
VEKRIWLRIEDKSWFSLGIEEKQGFDKRTGGNSVFWLRNCII